MRTAQTGKDPRPAPSGNKVLMKALGV